jgi:hypothetical protein
MCSSSSGFLELINNMLITGMVPTLFSEHEKGQICESIRNASKEAGFGATRFVLCSAAVYWLHGGPRMADVCDYNYLAVLFKTQS